MRGPIARPPRVHTRVTPDGIELRVDGTLASVIRPGEASTGPVWDAMAVPLLALPRPRLRRVLVLGFGAGSVARVARALSPSVHVVGVERDPEVVAEARRNFALDALGAEIVVDDALAYLRRERRTFDAVIDDVYEGDVRRLRKPPELVSGYPLVFARVARGGVLVVNTLDADTPRMARVLAARPGTLLRMEHVEYDNRIFALGPPALRAALLRARLDREPLFAATRPGLALRTLRP